MDLFGRAKKAMGGWSPPPPSKPQHFRVLCPDGHPIDGLRTESYQALRCPDCGEGVFVLPRSPLPEPKVPENRAPRPVKRAVVDDSPIPLTDPVPYDSEAEVEVELDDESVDQIEWVDEEPEPAAPVASSARPAPPPPPPPAASPITDFDPDLHLDEPAPAPTPAPVAASSTAKPSKPARPQPARPASAAARPSKPARSRVPVEDIELEPEPEREPIGRRLWRHRNALIAVGVIAAIALAGGIRFWRAKREELPKIYEKGKVEGLAALNRGDFPVAKELLREASRAAALLGSSFEDEQLNEVVLAAQEAAVFADLAPVTLEELVEKRARAKSPEEWQNTFDTFYKGQSVILASHVIALPDPSKPDSGYEIDYRIGYGVGPTPAGRGRVSLKGLRLVESARPKVGDLLGFGARLASVDLDSTTGDWLVTFEPDSGVFIQHTDALRALAGIPAEDDPEESR